MIEALAALVLGLLIGSFLNVCIYRLPRDLSVVTPARSFCPECERQIAWYDNVPVVSYLLLRGRCRQCAAAIPIRYLLVEILCGVMYFAIMYRYGLSALSLKLLLFATINVFLIFADFETHILPDEFNLTGIVLGLLFSWFVLLPPGFSMLVLPYDASPRLISFGESLFAAAFAAGSLWLIGYSYLRIRKIEGLGLGDVKMVAMIGAFLGLMPTLLVILGGSILGSILGVVYIFLRGKDARTEELPMGSFLGIAALVVAWLDAAK